MRERDNATKKIHSQERGVSDTERKQETRDTSGCESGGRQPMRINRADDGV